MCQCSTGWMIINIVGMGVLIEEAAELISNIERLRKLVVNKNDRRQFTKDEWKQLSESMKMQIIDIMPAIAASLDQNVRGIRTGSVRI